MSGIVVLSGDPRPDSRTARLATGVGTSTAQLLGARPPEVIDLAEYGHRLLVPDAAEVIGAVATVRDADLLVISTPAYNGTFTGVLKVFLDRFPAEGLAGRPALSVVVSATPGRAEVAEGYLHALLAEMGATTPGPGLAVAEDQLAQPDVLISAYLDRVRGALGVPSR
ncbi:MAG TPA: NAD(P)H-dependent oxidoreductase [Rugosimonospora sp.]